jgi:hypothetical protein
LHVKGVFWPFGLSEPRAAPHIRIAMPGQPRFIKINLMAPADCESYFGFMLIGDRPSR